MSLSEDALVAVCLCTRLGRGDKAPALDVREWTGVVRALQGEGATPGALLDGEIDRYGFSSDLEERIPELLRGLGSVGLEAERLAAGGIWILTRGDPEYPKRWKRKLGPSAPVALFGAGPRRPLESEMVALVGSRNVDAAGNAFAIKLAELCVREGWGVVSGGARGVDQVSVQAALDAGGFGVEILADSLERAVGKKAKREAILAERLTVLTPYLPHGPFTAGKAMGRNRLVYSLARYACVVASDRERGGTWGGATEALKKSLVPVFVRTGDDVPEGNRALIAQGAAPLPTPLADTLEAVFSSTDEPSIREGRQAEFDF